VNRTCRAEVRSELRLINLNDYRSIQIFLEGQLERAGVERSGGIEASPNAGRGCNRGAQNFDAPQQRGPDLPRKVNLFSEVGFLKTMCCATR
jgi:hypothetical protein